NSIRVCLHLFFFSSRRRHTRSKRDWSQTCALPIYTPSKNIHASGHGLAEELKMMLNIFKPEYFIPVQGEFKSQIAHARLASETGVKAENIFLLEKGDVVQYDDEKMFSTEKVEAGNVLIDGSGVGDVGNIVLRDRRLLSEDGIFIAVVTINR